MALLQEQSDIEDSPLYGITKTVQYLQNLGEEHIDLVCKYAEKVLEKSPNDGLNIFIDDLLEVENWPRIKVYEFLMKQCKEIVIPYLEHIINIWKETNSLFHNALIIRYKELVTELLDQPDSQDIEYHIMETKVKLRQLLNSSTYYTAETILPQFPLHCLYEERALLLGSLEKHKEALALYLFQVNDITEALKYCSKHSASAKIVFTTLYQLLVSPPDALSLKAMFVSHMKAHAIHEPKIKEALEILENHGTNIELEVVLSCTPSSVPLAAMTPYLESTLGSRVSKRHQMQLLRGLMHAEHLQVQEERIEMESQKVVVKDTDVCRVCGKRFRAQSALVRFPNGQIVHYFCQERAIVPNL